MSAHTPGPWVQKDAFGHAPHGTLVGPTEGSAVCSLTGYYGREGTYANARLIAAAPELLTALVELVERLGPPWFIEEDRKELLRLIAKATGETP